MFYYHLDPNETKPKAKAKQQISKAKRDNE
jgi:hypothetical protein